MPSRSESQLPATTLISVANAALGFGLGLLLSGRLDRSARKVAAISTMALGIVATLPLVAEIIADQVVGPDSARGVRRRLRSIREDAGFPSDGEVF